MIDKVATVLSEFSVVVIIEVIICSECINIGPLVYHITVSKSNVAALSITSKLLTNIR